MKIEQSYWNESNGWICNIQNNLSESANFLLVFGAIDLIDKKELFEEIKNRYSKANIVLCSTAGEILEDRVEDNSISITAICYEKTKLKFVEINVSDYENSLKCGEAIVDKIDVENLKHVLVISDGILVNGDELIKSMNDKFPKEVLVTGGLAADSGRFKKTFVGLNAPPKSGNIVAIGHYGDHISISHGSKGGWDEFGPKRTVTRAEKNVLYELDGKNALELYKKYLGDKAEELPGSALLFPLCIYGDNGENVVRTILSINESNGSMIFAGDIPLNSTVRFMMANFDKLIDGAQEAGMRALNRAKNNQPSLVLMISCIGRKLVLGPRIEEEVEAVNELFDENVVYTGFYSNGEISPTLDSVHCSLHNQTMTITTYSEI